MNLGGALLDAFLAGTIDSKGFILSCLDEKKSLSKFLHREFAKKKFKIDVSKLETEGKAKITFGKQTEWWLYTKKEVSKISENPEYKLPICNKVLFIVAFRRKK
jgi:hypothetical protein